MTAAVVAPLAACGNSDNIDAPVVVTPPAPPVAPAPPPPPATAAIETLGGRFAAIFRTDSNTEPTDVAEADIAPISFTTESVEISGF